ncbi:MAG TPA: DeoR family transcriptional regulator [Chloroflexi bacterium]|nr:DeoR family transcriptional regulator [Chloroflexota bacterium]
MITFERQQAILRLLKEQPGLKVTKLAELLDVSRGTIRNDLLKLEEQGKVKRMRGGAILTDHWTETFPSDPKSGIPVPANVEAKRRIARWAAELVEDGDAILLDASTTVQQMVPFLKNRRNLTVITNGLDTAKLLKRQTPHTIILLGGIVVNGASATGGTLGDDMLEQLHISTSFMSGVGFTLETGVTERSLEEAKLKEKMLAQSRRTAVLLDATKIGKVGLIPFAGLKEITHFLTDSDVPAEFIQTMREANVNLMVCGENTVRSHTVSGSQPQYILGFANQSEELPFAIAVRRGLERAAADLNNIDLVIADNKLSGAEALRVADKLIARNVDLVIEYQIDYKAGNLIMDKFRQANIPVIAVDIPMVGATFFGVDNYRAGYVGGEMMGQWLQREWQGDFDWIFVLEEPRAGTLPAARIQGQLDGVTAVLGELPEDKIIFLESGNTSSVSEAQVFKTLQSLLDARRIAILSFNSDAVTGALKAARRLGREQDIVIVGQGADQFVVEEIRQPESRVIGSTAYMPERYGEQLLQLALKILQGESVPPAVYTDHVFLNADNIDLYYPSVPV